MTDKAISISKAAQSNPKVQELIATHQAHCADHTPDGSGHAIPAGDDVETARDSETVFWLAEVAERPVGCIGFRQLSDSHGEIKTMHVLQTERGAGIADQLLGTALAFAKERGAQTVYLETGKSDGFAASRRFYARSGFEPCQAYGDYASDPFSYCMKMPI